VNCTRAVQTIQELSILLCTQVRNRDAGRIGKVYLKYDRENGRYFDVDTEMGKELCPIRPLWHTSPSRTIREPQSSKIESLSESLLSPGVPSSMSGEELREYNDHGGMV
jgi:hypothetical protein